MNDENQNINYGYFDSPVGQIEVQTTEEAVAAIHFMEKRKHAHSAASPLTNEVIAQLKAYFAEKSKVFDLPLGAEGTSFQKAVWKQLYAIPYGVTCSYGDIANRLDNPNAVRAVGAANGKNPISIVVPCHRVIGANGNLTGYAGGLERKTYLLSLEGALLV